ncbi:MAG TPA: sigma 54-interacting transcriptional regulator [Hyphomicrobiales bacterium]|nr:sigma 54-interacting transcriptional regulator [Hyphomicrobiales bacterium]
METCRPRVLLVDDDEDLLQLISLRLQANRYEVEAVDSAEKALQRLAQRRPHVVVTDMKMEGMDGMALFDAIQQRYLHLPVIILTANGTIADAVEATRQGVSGYLEKPFEAKTLLATLENALEHSVGAFPLHPQDGSQEWRRQIISTSAVMELMLEQARAAAQADASILIQSETGTGKEVLANAIHKASPRRDKPFVGFNCAALPEALLESELFGHVSGAFTGANRAHRGLFQAADGGTIFLDEIGDMPITAQAKLLRVLEQREVRPVGATTPIPVDIRIVAATHQDLAEKVEQGSFRQDLYYRLNVVTLELPPLRQRREDILPLAEHFSRSFASRNGRQPIRFSPEAAELLVSAPWPGNVRQIGNVVEQCSVLSPTPLVSRALVERALRYRSERLLSLNHARERFEHDYLVRILNLTQGNISLAARLAERNRTEFYKLLRRHGLDPSRFRRDNDAAAE